MQPEGEASDKNPDRRRMRPSDMGLDKAIGTGSPNEDGMKLAGVTCENNSDNEEVVEENVHTEKGLYAKGYCDCENSGNGERKFAGNNDKRPYVRGSGDCKNSGDDKKNCDREKRFYARESGGVVYKRDFSSAKRFYVRESSDGENSGDSKKNSETEKKCYVRGNCDCERMGSSCSSIYGGEGRDPAQTTMAKRGVATAAAAPMAAGRKTAGPDVETGTGAPWLLCAGGKGKRPTTATTVTTAELTGRSAAEHAYENRVDSARPWASRLQRSMVRAENLTVTDWTSLRIGLRKRFDQLRE